MMSLKKRSGSRAKKKDDYEEKEKKSSLRFEEHVDIVPYDVINGSSSMKENLEFGLQRERYWHVHWDKMIRKKIWLDDRDVRPLDVVPELPPHSEYLKLGCRGMLCGLIKEGNPNGPWPRGVQGSESDNSMLKLCWAYVLWTLNLKSAPREYNANAQHLPQNPATEAFHTAINSMYKDAWWTFYASFVIGMLYPVVALWMNFITDEVSSTSGTLRERKINVVLLAFGMFFVGLFILRTTYYWEVKIPGMCQQHHLRWVLMRRLLPGGGDDAIHSVTADGDVDVEQGNVTMQKTKKKCYVAGTRRHHASMSPGASLAILGPVIETANENIVQAFFQFIISVAEQVVSIIITVFLLHFPVSQRASTLSICLTVGNVAVTIALNTLTYVFYLMPMKKLFRLTSQWQVRYYALAADQLGAMRDADVDTDPSVTSAIVNDFWTATRLYRYRAFQSSIKVLVVEDLIFMIVQILNFLFVVVLAFEVLNPDTNVSIGTFVALTYLAQARASNSKQVTEIVSGIPAGYRALQQIAEVMNYGTTHDGDTSIVKEIGSQDSVHPSDRPEQNMTDDVNNETPKETEGFNVSTSITQETNDEDVSAIRSTTTSVRNSNSNLSFNSHESLAYMTDALAEV